MPNKNPYGIMGLQGGGMSYYQGSSGGGGPPGQPSSGPHQGYGGNQPGGNIFGGDQAPNNTGLIAELDELIQGTNQGPGNDTSANDNINYDALISAGTPNNDTDITTLDDGTISVPEVYTPSSNPHGDEGLTDETWELAIQAASNPGYEQSFEGQQLINEGINPGSIEWIEHFGLPQIISMTSSGMPTMTLGEDMDQGTQDDEFVYTGQGQYLLDNYNNPTGSYQEQVDDYYEALEAEQAQQGGGEYYYDGPTIIDEQKEKRRQLAYGPKASPIKNLEQSGFLNTVGSKMNNPYLKDMMDTLKGGLYSKTYVNPAAGFKPWGLEKHYATGQRSPLYKNVARGGIMSVWNDMRR